MPINLENQFIADTYKSLIHVGDISLNSGAPDALIYTGDGRSSSLTISTPQNGIKVNGPASISGNLNAKNTTLDGTLNCGAATINGNSNIVGDVLITGALNSSSHTVNGVSNISGNVSIGGALSAVGNTILRGTANISGNTVVGGTLNSLSHTVVGNSNISGALSSASHTVNGNSNISGNATVAGTLTAANTRLTNRLDAKTVRADTYENLPTGLTVETSAKQLFPVGSVYLTFANINPGSIPAFAGTRWEATAEGSFVLGVGGRTDNNGETRNFNSSGAIGGSFQHKLTINEMPKHNHIQLYSGGDRCDRWDCIGGGTPIVPQVGGGQGGYRNSSSMSTAGDNAFHNNTPPGFALYIWRRTA